MKVENFAPLCCPGEKEVAREVDAVALNVMKDMLAKDAIHAKKRQKRLGFTAHRVMHMNGPEDQYITVSKIGRNGTPHSHHQLLVPYDQIIHVAPVDPSRPKQVCFTHRVTGLGKKKQRTHVLSLVSARGAARG